MKITARLDVSLEDGETVDIASPIEPGTIRRVTRVVAFVGPNVDPPDVTLYGIRVYANGKTTTSETPIPGSLRGAREGEGSEGLIAALDAISAAHKALVDEHPVANVKKASPAKATAPEPADEPS